MTEISLPKETFWRENKMKFTIAQINTTPCDFEGNLKQILDGIDYASDPYEGAHGPTKLVVFPELSVPGYLCQDLMHDRSFIDRNYESIGAIKKRSKKYPHLRIVIGCVDRNTKGIGKPFWNVALVIHNGYVVARYNKQLLPFYDVFDEGRYFEPGTETTVFEIDGTKFGLTICEDLWNDKEQEEINYPNNPIQQYRDLGVDCLINISSSPYCQDKPFKRQQMIERIAEGFPQGVIYVNQQGGQDELVFDGCSTYVQRNDKRTYARYLMDEQDGMYRTIPLNPEVPDGESRDPIRHSLKYMKNMLVMGLRDYLNKSGFTSVVLGSSGGIDSALVACLAAEAIGAENVHCIMMPSVHSSDHSLTDAKELHKNLGCKEYIVPVDHMGLIKELVNRFGNFSEGLGSYNPVANENIQARMRGSYVMWFSNALGPLTLTTGNKTELAIGYATLYGDMCGGYAPICDLYKMEVYEIAKKFYGHWIPENIITKEPMAKDQLDVDDLMPYPLLDKIVKHYIESNVHSYDEFIAIEECDVPKEDYDRIIHKIDMNEFKRRQYAPGTKISRKSFGIGRRIPIVKGKKVL
jgi:NAD+ synthetase